MAWVDEATAIKTRVKASHLVELRAAAEEKSVPKPGFVAAAIEPTTDFKCRGLVLDNFQTAPKIIHVTSIEQVEEDRPGLGKTGNLGLTAGTQPDFGLFRYCWDRTDLDVANKFIGESIFLNLLPNARLVSNLPFLYTDKWVPTDRPDNQLLPILSDVYQEVKYVSFDQGSNRAVTTGPSSVMNFCTPCSLMRFQSTIQGEPASKYVVANKYGDKNVVVFDVKFTSKFMNYGKMTEYVYYWNTGDWAKLIGPWNAYIDSVLESNYYKMRYYTLNFGNPFVKEKSNYQIMQANSLLMSMYPPGETGISSATESYISLDVVYTTDVLKTAFYGDPVKPGFVKMSKSYLSGTDRFVDKDGWDIGTEQEYIAAMRGIGSTLSDAQLKALYVSRQPKKVAETGADIVLSTRTSTDFIVPGGAKKNVFVDYKDPIMWWHKPTKVDDNKFIFIKAKSFKQKCIGAAPDGNIYTLLKKDGYYYIWRFMPNDRSTAVIYKTSNLVYDFDLSPLIERGEKVVMQGNYVYVLEYDGRNLVVKAIDASIPNSQCFYYSGLVSEVTVGSVFVGFSTVKVADEVNPLKDVYDKEAAREWKVQSDFLEYNRDKMYSMAGVPKETSNTATECGLLKLLIGTGNIAYIFPNQKYQPANKRMFGWFCNPKDPSYDLKDDNEIINKRLESLNLGSVGIWGHRMCLVPDVKTGNKDHIYIQIWNSKQTDPVRFQGNVNLDTSVGSVLLKHGIFKFEVSFEPVFNAVQNPQPLDTGGWTDEEDILKSVTSTQKLVRIKTRHWNELQEMIDKRYRQLNLTFKWDTWIWPVKEASKISIKHLQQLRQAIDGLPKI